ncbi:MAG TPA: DUF1573 domain-containing protein [Gemmataceae bacterium]|nr:DUF1573 domain-containing protein [Gemmataceae bacterium]
MRKLALVIVAVAASTSAAVAQNEAPWAEKLFENKTEHDFGSVAHGTQMLHKFAFKNIYAVPLDVTISRISCGCTTATSSVARVGTKETGTIDVNMNGRLFTGPRTVRVYVTFSNRSVTPEVFSTAELRVIANSRQDIVFNPGAVSFGVVPQGQGAAQDITVEYAGTADWQVSDVVTNGLPVEAKTEKLRARPGVIAYKVSVSLKPDAPAGTLKGEMFLKTNDPVSPLLPVLVEGNVQASLSVSPSVVRVSAPVNETRGASVAVRGNKAFKILSVEGLGEGVTLTTALPDAAAETHRLTFDVKKSEAGDFRRKLKIVTDLQKAPLVVTVEGSVGN